MGAAGILAGCGGTGRARGEPRKIRRRGAAPTRSQVESRYVPRLAERIAMFWADPWFWTSLGIFGFFLVPFVVGSRSLGRHPVLGYVCTAFIVGPMLLLPLPFVDQPRFASPAWQAAGLVLAGIGLAVFVHTFFQVRAFTAPQPSEPLRTGGYYAIVRHPMTLSGVLAALGWALSRGSLIGMGLALVYGLCGWLGTFLEEERLVEEYGDDYRRYQQEVPRFLPLPRPRRKR